MKIEEPIYPIYTEMSITNLTTETNELS